MSRQHRPQDSKGRPARPVLVTGGAGFIGCNLADRLASEGHDVIVFDALSRPGVERNLRWLEQRHPERVSSIIADIRDRAAVEDAVGDAAVVFHFAAQVAVTSSLGDPYEDFEVNVRGSLLLLEALRRRREKVPLIFASTNKVYGDLGGIELVEADDCYVPADSAVRAHGVSERCGLDLHTPYGCSKGAADQYVLDYARSFGVPTAVMRMSCIYGPRQFGTEDQGWVAHFLIRALEKKPITVYGDGRQVRDILFVADAVNAYVAAWRNIDAVAGRAFNLGGGPTNAVSLRQLIAHIERLVGHPVRVEYDDWRASDQRYYVTDIRRVTGSLSLPTPIAWRQGVAALCRWLEEQRVPAALERSAARPSAAAA